MHLFVSKIRSWVDRPGIWKRENARGAVSRYIDISVRREYLTYSFQGRRGRSRVALSSWALPYTIPSVNCCISKSELVPAARLLTAVHLWPRVQPDCPSFYMRHALLLPRLPAAPIRFPFGG